MGVRSTDPDSSREGEKANLPNRPSQQLVLLSCHLPDPGRPPLQEGLTNSEAARMAGVSMHVAGRRNAELLQLGLLTDRRVWTDGEWVLEMRPGVDSGVKQRVLHITQTGIMAVHTGVIPQRVPSVRPTQEDADAQIEALTAEVETLKALNAAMLGLHKPHVCDIATAYLHCQIVFGGECVMAGHCAECGDTIPCPTQRAGTPTPGGVAAPGHAPPSHPGG